TREPVPGHGPPRPGAAPRRSHAPLGDRLECGAHRRVRGVRGGGRTRTVVESHPALELGDDPAGGRIRAGAACRGEPRRPRPTEPRPGAAALHERAAALDERAAVSWPCGLRRLLSRLADEMAGREQHARFQAFGSTAVVGVTDLRRMVAARAAVTEVVEAFDLACSRFRDDSELSMVNDADGKTVHVSPLLLETVAASLRAARLTDGDVDPTVGEALMALGYDRDYALVGAAEPRRIEIVPVPGWRTIKLDAEAGTIRLTRGVRLDLGAAAKALAADRAAVAARRAAGCGVLVSFGGDIALSGP